MTESTDPTQPWTPAPLGVKPYLFIEASSEPTAPSGFTLDVKAGGGIDTQDELLNFLLLTVEELTGVPVDLYRQHIDIVRHAAGLGPLNPTIAEDGFDNA